MMMDKYFEDLIQEKPIKFGYIDDKGKALFAGREFIPGEPLFNEMPYVAMQHYHNKEMVQGCENCYAVCGSIESQLAHFLQISIDSVTSVPSSASIEFHKSHPKKDHIECVCGAIYCSTQCQIAAWDRYHCLLCSGNPDSPMIDFVNHSTETNEIFLLAAQVICSIIMSYIRNKDLQAARQPVDMFCKLPWWEVVSTNADLEEGQTMEEYVAIFKDLLAHSVALFYDGLQYNAKHLSLHAMHPNGETESNHNYEMILDELESILSVDFFANVVGMFEMNNISLEIQHPIAILKEMYQESSDPHIQSWLSTADSNIQAKMELEDDECDQQDVVEFPYLEGTALFSLICMMNHSCQPNVAVSYEYGIATVVALSNINVGDELCISYIETDQDVDQRRQDLREYQFECQCPRCESEST